MMNPLSKRLSTLLLAAACAVPVAGMTSSARADGPATRPSHGGSGSGGGDRGMRPSRKDINSRAPLTPEQWNDVLAFMREHSARRTDDLEKLLTTSEEKRAAFMKQLVAAQYDYVTSLKNEDSELYELQINKIETQDAIYGMLRDTKGGMSDSQKKEFRELVVKLVDVNLSERQRRIVRARESLVRAQTTLEEDRKHKDAMVEDRMDQLLREGARPFKLDRPDSPTDAGAAANKPGVETFADGVAPDAKRHDGNGK